MLSILLLHRFSLVCKLVFLTTLKDNLTAVPLAYLYVCRKHKANKIYVILCFSKAICAEGNEININAYF
jgi:hypothetical protein